MVGRLSTAMASSGKTVPTRIQQGQQDFIHPRTLAVARGNSFADGFPRDKMAENVLVVSINDRKVKVTPDSDSVSLYALCRRWVRNDVPRKDQPALKNFSKLLPKPLPAVRLDKGDRTCQDNGNNESTEFSQYEDLPEGALGDLNEHDLLQSHMKHFKLVRKRLRRNHLQKIERYKQRLALLLHPNSN
eukprot:c23874_g1_i1 orf=388-951(-)